MPGRCRARPLGFSCLFLRPVNFHKAFSVRTSRLIYRAGEPGALKPCHVLASESETLLPEARTRARAFSVHTPGVIQQNRLCGRSGTSVKACITLKLYPSCTGSCQSPRPKVLPGETSPPTGNRNSLHPSTHTWLREHYDLECCQYHLKISHYNSKLLSLNDR